MIDFVNKKKIEPLIHAVYAMDDVVPAHRLMENFNQMGKIVLRIEWYGCNNFMNNRGYGYGQASTFSISRHIKWKNGPSDLEGLIIGRDIQKAV